MPIPLILGVVLLAVPLLISLMSAFGQLLAMVAFIAFFLCVGVLVMKVIDKLFGDGDEKK